MCELFAVSSKHPGTVTFSLDEFASHGGTRDIHVDGWGIAFYQDFDIQLIRETIPAAKSEWLRFVRSHQTASSLIMSHIRKASRGGISLKNTQPFVREVSGRKHVFAHNGFLDRIEDLSLSGAYLPVGETDSEYAFCYLLDHLQDIWKPGIPSLQARVRVVAPVFEQLAQTGPANFLYCDGEYLFAYGNKRIKPSGLIEPPGLHYSVLQCCLGDLSMQGFNFTECTPLARQKMVMIASVPLTDDKWSPLACGEMIVVKQGELVYREMLSTDGGVCQPVEL